MAGPGIHVVSSDENYNEDHTTAVDPRPVRIRAAALSTGITPADWAAFVDAVGPPPGCYDKRCRWFVLFGRQFGQPVADSINDAVFG